MTPPCGPEDTLRGTCAGGCRRVPSGHGPQRAWVLSLDLICQPDGRGRCSSSSLQGRVCIDTSGRPDAREPSCIVLNHTSTIAFFFFFFKRNGSKILRLPLFLSETSGGCTASLPALPLGEKHLNVLLSQWHPELGPQAPVCIPAQAGVALTGMAAAGTAAVCSKSCLGHCLRPTNPWVTSRSGGKGDCAIACSSEASPGLPLGTPTLQVQEKSPCHCLSESPPYVCGLRESNPAVPGGHQHAWARRPPAHTGPRQMDFSGFAEVQGDKLQ